MSKILPNEGYSKYSVGCIAKSSKVLSISGVITQFHTQVGSAKKQGLEAKLGLLTVTPYLFHCL
jgi:hypothetical protein